MRTKPLQMIIGLAVILIFTSSFSYAGFRHKDKKFRITITNITRGQIFSPPIVITHNSGYTLFETGEPASPELAALAEDGNPGELINVISTLPAVLDYAVAEGPLLPGNSVTLEVNAYGNFNLLSLAGMLVTTNDAFFSIRNTDLPFSQKSIKLNAEAYDAGSEANSEDCNFIPGPPCGSHNVRDTDEAEGYIHIHPGIHGVGDLIPFRDDWKNPVAEIMIQKAN